MDKHTIKYALIVILHLLALAPLTLFAQIDCETLPRIAFLPDDLKINQQHIFCGEWDRDRPKGFHAQPNGKNPSSVARLFIQSKPNKAGVYTIRWKHSRNPSREKFSSMFPDQCSQQQVLNSILYASRHEIPCPSNSPGWLQCGRNRPSAVSQKDDLPYCSDNDTFFTIGLAFDRKGIINTAFPFFE